MEARDGMQTKVHWVAHDIYRRMDVLRKAKSTWSDSLAMALEVNAMQKGLVAVDVGGKRFHAQRVCMRSCSVLTPPACEPRPRARDALQKALRRPSGSK